MECLSKDRPNRFMVLENTPLLTKILDILLNRILSGLFNIMDIVVLLETTEDLILYMLCRRKVLSLSMNLLFLVLVTNCPSKI